MKINILLPFKEKFDKDKASSVSITVKNNLQHTNYLKDVKIFGQHTENPLYKKNFIGIKYNFLSFKSRNYYLADRMIEIISENKEKKQLIEIHNRPYLVNYIFKKIKGNPISLFFHTDPKTMKGSKTIKQREELLNKCSRIFCVSKFIKNQFLDGIKTNKNNVYLLYNGVEKVKARFPLKLKQILFVGRLVPEKGVDIFVDSIQNIAPLYPDWDFLLIGSSELKEKEDSNFYKDRVVKKFLSIGKQAKFFGQKNNEFVVNIMKNASIIIIPSRNEAFGLVIAEALSNGLAIIASDVGAIPEILEDNGIKIKNINHLKVYKNLIQLISNNSKRKKLQKKAWDSFKYSSIKSSEKLDKHRKSILHD